MAAAPGAGAPPPPPSYAQEPPAAAEGGLAENVAGALCYFFGIISGILFLVLAPYNTNKTIRFHAFQSIFLGAAIIVLVVVATIANIVLAIIAHILGTLFGLLMLVVWLGVFVLWIMLMVKAYQGQKLVLPIIGPLAEKQA
jgi:uncharacterized membrane protein